MVKLSALVQVQIIYSRFKVKVQKIYMGHHLTECLFTHKKIFPVSPFPVLSVKLRKHRREEEALSYDNYRKVISQINGGQQRGGGGIMKKRHQAKLTDKWSTISNIIKLHFCNDHIHPQAIGVWVWMMTTSSGDWDTSLSTLRYLHSWVHTAQIQVQHSPSRNM